MLIKRRIGTRRRVRKVNAGTSVDKQKTFIAEESIQYKPLAVEALRTISYGALLHGYLHTYSDFIGLVAQENIKNHPIYKKFVRLEQRHKKTTDNYLNCAIDLFRKCDTPFEAIEYYKQAYMSKFSKQERQSKGKVYTPQSIIDWIHDQLEKQSPLSLDKTYWEPACGTGRFVTDWYDRLLRHWEDNQSLYPEIKDRNQAHKHIIEKCLYFSDMDLQAVRLTRFSLFLKNPEVNFTELKINSFVGDSLLDQLFGDRKFDYMAGNPPYVSFQNGGLSSCLKRQYQQSYDFYSGKGDILNLFFELATKRSSFCGFVTSRYWMESALLKVMHRELKSRIMNIWDHGSDKSEFGNVMVRTACFIFSANRNTSETFEYNNSSVERSSLKDDGWFFDNDLICDKILSKSKRLNEVCSIYNGVYTGDSNFFIVEEPANTVAKVATGKVVRKWNNDWQQKFLLRETSEREYARDFDPVWLEKQGILARMYIDTGHYGFSLKEEYIGLDNNVFLIIPFDSREVKGFLAVLNSRLMEYYFSKKIKRRANNYMITLRYYRSLPLPKLTNDILVQLEQLVDKMLANPNDKQTEQQINQIVYKLYDLNEEEIEIVENL